MVAYIFFCVLGAIGIILIIYGIYEKFYQNKKGVLAIGSAIMTFTLIYFAVNSYKNGIDYEFVGEMLLAIGTTALFLISIFKKNKS